MVLPTETTPLRLRLDRRIDIHAHAHAQTDMGACGRCGEWAQVLAQ